MNHQPFESWIFDDAPLADAQQQELDAHLQDCSACRELFEADRHVISIMGPASMRAPAPGFRARFEHRLAEQQRTRRIIQILGLSAMVLGLLVLVSLFVGGFLFTRYVPFTRAVTGAGTFVIQLALQMRLMLRVVGMVVGAFLTTLPQALLLAAAVTGMGLTGLWLFSLYRISSQPVWRQ